MANKRYYWLKLKEDFFKDLRMKKLRSIAGGDTYTIIYLKLQLLSLKDEGYLYFEGIEKTLGEELALEIDEKIEDVDMCLAFLFKTGLIEQVDTNVYEMTQTRECIGSEAASTIRSRNSRNNKKVLHCNTNATLMQHNCNIEIDIEKDIEIDIDKDNIHNNKKERKHKYGEYKNVLLTDKELQSLESDYDNVPELIKYLDEYIEMKGYKAKSHYLCIRKWVVKAVRENNPKSDIDRWLEDE